MKLTLDDAWKHCLEQWEFVAKEVQKLIGEGKWPKDYTDQSEIIYGLKRDFIYNDRFCDILLDCFFCEYHKQLDNDDDCSGCPAKLMDSEFRCENPEYHYLRKPLEFYAEIQRLYQIYEENKKAGIKS